MQGSDFLSLGTQVLELTASPRLTIWRRWRLSPTDLVFRRVVVSLPAAHAIVCECSTLTHTRSPGMSAFAPLLGCGLKQADAIRTQQFTDAPPLALGRSASNKSPTLPAAGRCLALVELSQKLTRGQLRLRQQPPLAEIERRPRARKPNCFAIRDLPELRASGQRCNRTTNSATARKNVSLSKHQTLLGLVQRQSRLIQLGTEYQKR